METREQNPEMYCFLKKEQQRERNCTLLCSSLLFLKLVLMWHGLFWFWKSGIHVLCTSYIMMELIGSAHNACLSYTVDVYN